MGLTPLSGLPGATRTGDVDACLAFHYIDRATDPSEHVASLEDTGPSVTRAEDTLNRKAGWKALTGTSDFGKITRVALGEGGDENEKNRHGLALEMFTDRILHYVGAYFLKLQCDVDGLVFSGGIGEHSAELRKKVGAALRCLGFAHIDAEKNGSIEGGKGVVFDLSAGEGKKMLVCKTDEQLEMVKQCLAEKKFWE
jgi:acetate kinase